jgi:predicted nucleotidyltransferase
MRGVGPTRPRRDGDRYNRDMETPALETALREFVAAAGSEIVAVYLFGSQARGTAGPASDIDLAILYADEPHRSLDGLPLDLEADLERTLGTRVQVIVLNRAPVDLVHRVLRDGKLLLDRDRSRRIRFEVKARNEFFDLQPVLARYRAAPASAR